MVPRSPLVPVLRTVARSRSSLRAGARKGLFCASRVSARTFYSARVNGSFSKKTACRSCDHTNLLCVSLCATLRLSLQAAAPLAGLGSNPAVEDLPPGPGEWHRHQDRLRGQNRRHGAVLKHGLFWPGLHTCLFGRILGRICVFWMWCSDFW